MNELAVYRHGAQSHSKAVHYSRYYTLEQLKHFYSTASLGFICASFASWALMSFFIGQFFAGAEFEYMDDWRPIQFVYAVMGIALATAITIAEAVLFNSGRAREYLAVVGFAIGFSIFAETAATMQREQSSVAFKSIQSEVYKATIKAVDSLATTSTLTPAQLKLSQLQASYAEAKQLGNKSAMEALQGRILRLEQQAELEQANRTTSLQNTITQAKNLEYDETKHQAMIRFLAEVFGISHVVSSALLAFFLILTFKICFHYLGSMRQLNERAISINTGKISASIEQFRIAPAVINQEKLQVPSSAEQATKKASDDLQLPVLQLPVKNTGIDENRNKSTAYTQAELTKVNSLVSCPNCGAEFQKSNKWHLFCSNNRKPRADGGNCSDDWHNAHKPERSEVLKAKQGANKGRVVLKI
ncbi:MAG: hypothetical protein E6Q83_16425 [Thiothrix sp.]|nr:MAG: hypothetical protein E6Q83_16425 [Thiothrix sp.]